MIQINGDSTHFVDSLSFQAQTEDVSEGRTPGSSNVKPYLNKIFINEYLAGNDAILADENGEFDDWIELYNADTIPVDVGGLFAIVGGWRA